MKDKVFVSVLMVAMLSVSGVAQSRFSVANVSPYVVAIGGSVADTYTTLRCVGVPGVSETNPIIGHHPSTTAVVLLGVVGAALIVGAMVGLQTHDHVRLARVAGYVRGSVGVVAGVNNFRVCRE